MEGIFDFLKNLIIGVWIIMAIAVTICLLSYNKYHVSQFGNTSLLIIDNDELEPNFKEGDLLLVKKESNKKINKGDTIFFYNAGGSNNYLINLAPVIDKEVVNNTQTTFLIEGAEVSSDYVIGRTNGTRIVKNMGTVLGICSSKWGYIITVIFPTLFSIVYEVVEIFREVRNYKES